jgi:hypothetical protein
VYLTLGNPTVTTLYETLVDVACRDVNVNSDDPDAVFDQIWSTFQTLEVARKAKDGFNTPDGVVMKYWVPGQGDYYYTPQLILNGNGKCGAWARFHRDCVKVHGIAGAVWTIIKPIAIGSLPRHLYVKNWDMTDVPPALPSPLPGVPAQGYPTTEPSRKYFDDHAVVVYQSTFYDCSYGHSYPSRIAWQRASLAAVSHTADTGWQINSGETWGDYTEIDTEEP